MFYIKNGKKKINSINIPWKAVNETNQMIKTFQHLQYKVNATENCWINFFSISNKESFKTKLTQIRCKKKIPNLNTYWPKSSF